ncbi:hypothetical protein VTN31DRAFT_7395 [Thermomyces dupontii]|uniref:uncharacterized protein n=1 Tax=Talaromyces thermophilus TaxID=28565 RepID=UPI003742D65F
MLQAVGGPVPPNTDHAVSVSLPTWRANVGYEEGEDWVVSKMTCGYPRFFVHPTIQKLVQAVLCRSGSPEKEHATLFPSSKTAEICRSFIFARIPASEHNKVRVVVYALPQKAKSAAAAVPDMNLKLFCVIYPKEHASIAKQVWQHTGDGISSRRGEFCLNALEDGYLVEECQSNSQDSRQSLFSKGPKRYQQRGTPQKDPEPAVNNTSDEGREFAQFIEERFGRNLNSVLAGQAKLAIRRRIAGSLTADVDLHEALKSESSGGRIAGITENDVFLFPCGMSSIFNTHRNLLAARGESLKSICFGFPYTDTLKILEKWGPGCLFYGHGSSEDLDDLEARLSRGERFLALFTEFPSNPLLKSPDLIRISNLAKKYDFAVVVDETIGNFINVNVLRYADVVVSSLTKIFSGDSNVMGGSAVLNPHGQYYPLLKETFAAECEDNLWVQDAVFLERNSRDFVKRIERINATTETVTAFMKSSPLVKEVYYPIYSPTRANYDACRHPNGGYGGLFSVSFHTTEDAKNFFDALEILKGPSLGTNFTLSCPYTLIAHYNELPWASTFDVPWDLVRVSVGLEDAQDLVGRMERALRVVQEKRGEQST